MAIIKKCPILAAAMMLNQIHTETNKTTIHQIYTKYPECMGKDCEWFGNGCPAYPTQEKASRFYMRGEKNGRTKQD